VSVDSPLPLCDSIGRQQQPVERQAAVFDPGETGDRVRARAIERREASRASAPTQAAVSGVV